MAKRKTSNRKNFGFRHVVKRHGRHEKFDERKVYASVYESAHAAQVTTKQAEKIAEKTTEQIKKWIEKKDRINSHEIHTEIARALKKHDMDVAFMYETHKDIC